jgi:hypothetical protein
MQQPYTITYKIVVLYRGKGYDHYFAVHFVIPPTHFDATGSSLERNNKQIEMSIGGHILQRITGKVICLKCT